MKKNRKNAFTLIELLAVIIILGILMIIAIPSVTRYISDSRKSAYIDTAKQVISAAKNLVNSGKLEMYDTNVTYYIPNSCIRVENGEKAKSPYGEFIDDKTYVVVTYDGKGYDYYWVSLDDTGTGVKELKSVDELNEDNIESDLTNDDVKDNIGVGNRKQVKIFNSTCDDSVEKDAYSDAICKRATILHSTICNGNSGSYGCYSAGYNEGKTDNSKNTKIITYGNQNISNGILTPGDAFDCDVNDDGIFDSNTERFYYVSRFYDSSTNSFDNTKAVLIFYGNVSNDGNTITNATQNYYKYYENDEDWRISENWHGPATAYKQLPNVNQWKNQKIELPKSRQIVNELGEKRTNNGTNTIDIFTYTNKAARFLTYQEVQSACGTGNVISLGYLDGCNYLLENIGEYEGSPPIYGYWLETPTSSYGNWAWYIYGRRWMSSYGVISYDYGVRPVIDVKISNIDY